MSNEAIIYSLSLGFVPKLVKHNLQRTEEWNKIIQKEARVSVAISGGLNSEYVLSEVRKRFPDKKITCVHVQFRQNDMSNSNVQICRDMATKYDADFRTVGEHYPFHDLKMLCKLLKEPKFDVQNYYIAKLAKKYSNVLITGDTGSALFGGNVDKYKQAIYEASKLSITQKTANLPDIAQRIEIYKKGMLYDTWISDNNDMFTFGTSEIEKALNGYFYNFIPTNNPTIESMLWGDIHGKTLFDTIPNMEKFCKKLKIQYVPLMWSYENFYYSSILPWYMKYDYINDIGEIPVRKRMNLFGAFKDNQLNKINYDMEWIKGFREVVDEGIQEKKDVIFKVINEKWYNDAIKTTNTQKRKKLMQIYCLSLLAK